MVVAKGLGRIAPGVCWGKSSHSSQKVDCTDYIYTTYLVDSSDMCCMKYPHPNSFLCSSGSSFPHTIKLTTR